MESQDSCGWAGNVHNQKVFCVPTSSGWWRPRKIKGVLYNFEHLWPFDFQLTRPETSSYAALDVLISVRFDCHVVSEGHCQIKHGHLDSEDSSVWFDTGRHARVFHVGRYDRSKLLPDMIKGLATSKTACFRAKKNNYMIWRPDGSERGSPYYQSFFTLTKSGGDNKILMYIQTAYVKEVPVQGYGRKNRENFVGQCLDKLGLKTKNSQ